MMSALEMARRAAESLVERLGARVVAVALFGSVARGEASWRSDIDLFVVVKDLPGGLERRFRIYDAAYEPIKGDVTVIDVDEGDLFREDLRVTPLLLNVAWDGAILHDPTGRLTKLFNRIREMVKKAGLERYRTPDGAYGWRPKGARPLGLIEV